MRHQAGIVDQNIDAVVGLHGVIHQMAYLIPIRDVCLNGCAAAQ
jgi:hypothetical protein